MVDKKGIPKRANWPRWLDPRGKSSGSIGFLINRVSGLGLTVYLFLHLFVLGKLVGGQEAFDSFIELAHHPIIVAGEFIVILAVLLHGFNGLRIAFTGVGYGTGRQKKMLIVAIFLAVICSLIFAKEMFGGAS